MKLKTLGVWCVLLLYLFPFYAYADEREERRIKISVTIFPKIIAVDNNLKSKLSEDNTVKILFIFDKNQKKAEELSSLLKDKVTNIAGNPISISVMGVRDVSSIFSEKITAIFITERLDTSQLNKIISAGVSKQILVFSPYAGDVERGVTVGIVIGNRIKLYFNVNTLNESKIKIKEKILKISKRYE